MSEESSAPTIPFGDARVGHGHPVLIIAEIGINHEGDIDICARMIEEAANAGSDAIKLQTSDPKENYSPGTESYDVFSRSQLSPEDTAQMFRFARELGVEPFTTTAESSLEWVERLRPAAYKVSSGLLEHLPFVARLAKLGRPLLMSTGMSERGGIDDAVETARRAGAEHIALFQCTSLYPAPAYSLNLSTIRWLEKEYLAPAGFSDHSGGTQAAPLSVAAGARLIETHFTLDRAREGFDHRISLEPGDFRVMVDHVRLAETMMGRQGKKLLSAEQAREASRMRRYLVAATNISVGAIIQSDHIKVMRLAEGKTGLLPKRLNDLVGVRAPDAVARLQPFPEDFLANDQ